MRKVKDKTNILMIMQSLARQIFALQAFGQGNKDLVNKRIRIIKQRFNKSPALNRQLRLRRLMQGLTLKDPKSRQKLIQSVIGVSKKIDNSKVKKKLVQEMEADQSYWVKPNKLQQRIGNVINNSRYYGMNFYKQQEGQVRQVLRQKFSGNITQTNVPSDSVQQLCQGFNDKYRWLSQDGKKLIKDFLYGNPIQQRKVLNQVTQLKQKLNRQSQEKLDFIIQNTSKMDKFDKVFMLTSILDPRSCENL